MMEQKVSTFEVSMDHLLKRLDSIDRRLRSMETSSETVAPEVAVSSAAATAAAESAAAAATAPVVPPREGKPDKPLPEAQEEQVAVLHGAFENTGHIEGETEDNIPTVAAAPVPCSVVAERLRKLLVAHPYLNPGDEGQQSHSLHYWVNKCRAEIKEGHSVEAQKHLERIRLGIEASHAEKKSAFDRFDLNKDGQLDKDEFECMCAYLGLGEAQAHEMFDEAMEDGLITLAEFEEAVGKAGGMVKLLEKRRAHVSVSQWGVAAHHTTHAGSRVRSHYYIKGKKSQAWKEAQVLKVRVVGKCPDAPKDGVSLLFGYGADSHGVGNWQARQVVPPSWIVSGSDDSQVALALREVGILEEQQSFWASIFPEHELRAMARLVPCQREALRTVRQQASLLHDKALPEVRNKFKELGYGDREMHTVLTWIEDLAPTVVHVHIDKVGRFMEIDDFYRNQFETHTSCGALDDGNETRVGWERELFGGCYDSCKPFDRPKYGALSVMNDYRGVTSASQYGDSYMVLKNVRLRCTFASEDSGGMAGNRLAVLDKYAHVLNEYNDEELRGLIRVAQAAQSRDKVSANAQLLRGSTVDSQQEWVTLGFPEQKQSSGVYYFEVTLSKDCSSPQVGIVTDRFERTPRRTNPQGVGDDAESWAVDGLHAARWHNAEIRAWSQSWPNQNNTLSEEVLVGVVVDLTIGKLWFSSNGQWDDNPAFDLRSAMASGAAVYPAISLLGMATYNFGPSFKYEPPMTHFWKPWPGLTGSIQVTSPLVGNSDILCCYKEIQIHGEVNLARNVQRLVANQKYKDMPKSNRSWSMSVTGAGACDGDYHRSGAIEEMPTYENESGASLKFSTGDRCWQLFEKDSTTWFASANVGKDCFQPPRKGWEVPDEAMGVVTVEAFKTALSSAGVKETDVQRLLDNLTGCDSKGNQMVFKKKGCATLTSEWEKLSGAPVDAEAAWAAVVEEMKTIFMQEAGFSAGAVVETAHPYTSVPEQRWEKDVCLKGSEGLDVYFGSKSSTLDSCAKIGIVAGPLTKTSAGPGARLFVQTCGGQYNREYVRGTIERKSDEDGSWQVILQEEDVRNSCTYQAVLGEDEDDSDDDDEDEEEKEAEDGEDEGKKQEDAENTDAEEKKEEDAKVEDTSKEETKEKIKLICICALEHQCVEVEYKDGKKISDEIAGFAVDKSCPLSPVTIMSFKKAGPAQEAGVKAGWFLDLSMLFENYQLVQKVQSLEGDDLGDAPGDLRSALADLDSFGKRLNKLLETSEDISLTFFNGLDAKLLPSALVKYENGNKVGDEIDSFDTDGTHVTISDFKEEEDEDDEDDEDEGGEEEKPPEEKDDAEPKEEKGDTEPKEEEKGDTEPKKEKRKVITVCRDSGVTDDWQLDIEGTLEHSGSSLSMSAEDIRKDPSCLLELSNVTLVFEPGGGGDFNFREAYGQREDDDSEDDNESLWRKVHIPKNSCTFKWESDHDTSNSDQVRWGVFAVVVPSGSGEPPTQEAVDKLCEKWASSVSRAKGIEPKSIQVEQLDWDEHRLRELCKKYDWEFEWMTVEGERQRRLRPAALPKTRVPRSRASDSERPDGWTAEVQAVANPQTTVRDRWAQVHKEFSDANARVPRDAFISHCIGIMDMPWQGDKRKAFEEYVNALFDTGTALMLPAQKTDLGKHCFGYMSLLVPEFYGDTPKDTLCLAGAVRPEDDFKSVRAGLDADWDQVGKDSSKRVTEDAFVKYFLTKHAAKLVPETQSIYEKFLRQDFKASLSMMLPEKKTTLGGHCFRYGSLVAGEFYFDAAKDATTGCGCSSPVADVLGVTRAPEVLDPKKTVQDRWAQVHAGIDSNSRVAREAFVTHCNSIVPLPDEKREAFEEYVNALFDTGTALMLPARKTDLGKHCFGYMSLLAPEFYADKPKDTLSLAGTARPEDDFKTIRAGLDADWDKVQKNSDGRVTEVGFVMYFLEKYGEKLIPETIPMYEKFLSQNFDSCLAMMLPKQPMSLGGHCFRYGALVAGEFYFDAAKDATTGCGCSSPVADVLGITK